MATKEGTVLRPRPDEMLRYQAEDMVRGAITESPQYKAMIEEAMGMLKGVQQRIKRGAKVLPKRKGMHKMPDGSMMADSKMAPPPPARE